MAKGDKKKQFMERTGKDEAAYYEHSRQVCEKRHFNMRISTLLKCFGFDPLKYMEEKSAAMQPQVPLSEADYKLWLVQDCKSPLTLLQAYIEYYNDDSHNFTKEAHIARWIKHTPEESFLRFGDKNLIEKKHAKTWFDQQGMPLDVQAMEISELSASHEIEPQDLVEFIIAYPKGSHSYKPETMRDKIEQVYFEITGMRLTIEFATLMAQLLKGEAKMELNDVPF